MSATLGKRVEFLEDQMKMMRQIIDLQNEIIKSKPQSINKNIAQVDDSDDNIKSSKSFKLSKRAAI